MSPEDLVSAAFWEKLVCLDCNAVLDEAPEEICPSCGSPAVYSAAFLQLVAQWLNSN